MKHHHPRHRDFDQFLPDKMTDSFMTTTLKGFGHHHPPTMMLLHILEWFWLFAPFACHFWNIFKGSAFFLWCLWSCQQTCAQAKGIRSRKTTRPKLKGIDGYSKPMRVVSSESTFTNLIFYPRPSHPCETSYLQVASFRSQTLHCIPRGEGDTQWPRPDDRPAGNLRWTSKRTKFHGN